MSTRIHLRNLLFNWGGHAASLLVMFFLSPYIVGKLDAVSYGIWSLITVLTGYMGLFDLGVRASVGRHIALYLGKKDEEGVDETIRAGFGFFSLTAGLILLIGILLGWLFPEIFQDVPEVYHNIVKILLPLMVLNVWLAAVAAIYSSVLAAHYRFDVARSVGIAVLAVRTASTVWFLYIGWGLWGLAISVFVGNVLAVVANRICAGYHHSNLRSWPFLYSRKRLKEIINYGLAAFLVAISTKIIGQTDLVLAGVFLSVSSVREYSVGAMIVYYSSTFIKIISRTFFPVVQRAIAGGRIGEARHFFNRQVNIALCFGLLAYIGFAVYSKPFIRLWMLQEGFDENSVSASAEVMNLLAIAQLPLLYTQASLNFFAATGHIRLSAGMSMAEAVINLGLSIYFVIFLHWGLLGIAAGTLASRFVITGFFTPICLNYIADISFKFFVIKIIMPGMLTAGLLASFCSVLIWAWYPTTWIALWSHILLATLFWSVLSFGILLPNEYRERIINLIRKGVSRSLSRVRN